MENKNKLLKNINDVEKLIGVKKHVLRHWENRLNQLGSNVLSITKGNKKNSGNINYARRYYRDTDITVLKRIKFLLYNKKLTMKGGVKELNSKSNYEVLPNYMDNLKTISSKIRSIINKT